MVQLMQTFNTWKSTFKANKLKVLLHGASDPKTVIVSNQELIDDMVVTILIDESVTHSQKGNFEQAVLWAELAQMASVVGGDSLSLGEAWNWQASLYLILADSIETDNQENDNLSRTNKALIIRHQALECATQALNVYTQAGAKKNAGLALRMISVVYQTLGEILPAIQFRLNSILGWVDIKSIENDEPDVFQSFLSLFSRLEGDDIYRGAKLLVDHIDELRKIAQQKLGLIERAEFFELLGSACKITEQYFEVLNYWEQAVNIYHQLQSTEDEFHLYERMQDYARFVLYDLDQSILYGEHCVQVAPNDTEPHILAGHYHLLGADYDLKDRRVDAIEAINCAADLYIKSKEFDFHAGECLLRAGILEKEIGAFNQARSNLEKCLHLPAIPTTYWLAHYHLASFLTGPVCDFGAAIENAEQAVQMAISCNFNLTFRAAALVLLGQLYLQVGDRETLLNRAELLIEIQAAEELSIQTIQLNSLDQYQIFPPPKGIAYGLAMAACLKLGLLEKAEIYFGKLELLSKKESYGEFLDQYLNMEGDAEFNEFMKGTDFLYKGEQLLLVSPQEAIFNFDQAAIHFLERKEMELLAQVYSELGIAHTMVQDWSKATNAFYKTLEILDNHPNPLIEFRCYAVLGEINVVIQQNDKAYTYLHKAIELVEKERTSLLQIHQIEKFAEGTFKHDTYKSLIKICVSLGKFREAFETTEKLKSRVFIDLLSHEQWIPIDFKQLSNLDKLRGNRSKWYHSYLSERFDEAELRSSMLNESVVITEAELAIKRNIVKESSLIKIDKHELPLEYGGIQNVLNLK